MNETPVKDAESVKIAPVSPAQDLRNIQALLVSGSFPGTMAPAVVKAYHLLDSMASVIEKAVAAKDLNEHAE